MPTSPPTGYGTSLVIKGVTYSWFNGGFLSTAAYYFGSVLQANNATATVKIVPNSQFQKFYGGSAPYGGAIVQNYVDTFNDTINPWLIQYTNPEGITSCMAMVSPTGTVDILSYWGSGSTLGTSLPAPFSEIDPATLSLVFTTGPVLQFYYNQGVNLYAVIYDESGVNQLQIRDGNWVFYNPTFLPYVTFPITGVGNSYFMVPSRLPQDTVVKIIPRLQSGSGPAAGDAILKTISGSLSGTTWTDLSVDVNLTQIMDQLDSIETKLASTVVNVTGIVDNLGDFQVRRGNDYLEVDALQITFTAAASQPYNFSGTSSFKIYDNEGTTILTQALTILSGTQLQLELTAVQTATLSAGKWRYEIINTLTDGSIESLVGNVIVEDQSQPI